MPDPVIAIIFDCDGTLSEDTITFMLEKYEIDPQAFWNQIKSQVEDGWDPPAAYMQQIMQYVQDRRIENLTIDRLRELGQELTIYPGLPNMFGELRQFVLDSRELQNYHVTLEFYIISGGLEEIINGSPLASSMNGIFGCNFYHDPETGLPTAIKSTVTFTEKTRFVFAIHKGISAEDARIKPYRINDQMEEGIRRIPFGNMIYVGDGPSDVPCMSLIKEFGGACIGVTATRSFEKGYELARGNRTTFGPYSADYRRDTDMRKMLEQIILVKGLEIGVKAKQSIVEAPNP